MCCRNTRMTLRPRGEGATEMDLQQDLLMDQAASSMSCTYFGVSKWSLVAADRCMGTTRAALCRKPPDARISGDGDGRTCDCTCLGFRLFALATSGGFIGLRSLAIDFELPALLIFNVFPQCPGQKRLGGNRCISHALLATCLITVGIHELASPGLTSLAF